MKSYFFLCLMFFIFMNNISYGQSYECDNNFEECGTPDQSGGGGGGQGTVLISNTDLGDNYQHADDYDDDGVEDSSDNCLRISNPSQYDRDGDSIGDMCDNCLNIWNDSQENIDGDDWGDFCDDDIDNDSILNFNDECPFHWGATSCFNYFSDVNSNNDSKQKSIKESNQLFKLKTNNSNRLNNDSCNTLGKRHSFIYYFLIILILRKYRTINVRN